MRDASPWTRFKQGIGQDFQRVWDRLGPARARVQGWWQSLSLPYKLFFVMVGLGLLMILATWGFSWEAFRITALSHAPWYIGAIGIGFVLLVLLVLLWRLPKRKASRLNLGPKEQFDVENETRKTWATIVGGMAVLFSLLFTWGNLRVTQDNLRITQEAATKSQEITRQGQITDRFTKAVAQLGEQDPEKLAVRLGGIYALERIARESPGDHWPIMEILAAYVRANAPWPPKIAKPPKDTPLQQDNPTPRGDPAAAPGQSPPKLATDIQAILTVFGRRTQTFGKGEREPLDLRETDLRGADLWQNHLEKALLIGTHLEGVDLREARLEGAFLSETHMKGARLDDAHLERADLSGAHLEGVTLLGAYLERARLSGAHLKGAILIGVHLENASLAYANLEGAFLDAAHLQGAVLFGANLEGASLQWANLEGAFLGASSSGPILSERVISETAYLKGADFRGANLEGVSNVTVEQFSTVKTLYQAQLDPPLLEQIQRQYPHLLEKPQDWPN